MTYRAYIRIDQFASEARVTASGPVIDETGTPASWGDPQTFIATIYYADAENVTENLRVRLEDALRTNVEQQTDTETAQSMQIFWI